MRHLLSVALILLCFSFLSVIAYAHPGGTDSSGGHYNRSTGEYHYHHGHSAHDHYDMDGDGVIDCPYDFEDATKKRAGSSQKDKSATLPTAEPNDGVETRFRNVSFFDWVSALAESFFPSLALSFILICLLSIPAQILFSEQILKNCFGLFFWVIFIIVYVKMTGMMLK